MQVIFQDDNPGAFSKQMDGEADIYVRGTLVVYKIICTAVMYGVNKLRGVCGCAPLGKI